MILIVPAGTFSLLLSINDFIQLFIVDPNSNEIEKNDYLSLLTAQQMDLSISPFTVQKKRHYWNDKHYNCSARTIVIAGLQPKPRNQYRHTKPDQ